MTSVDEILRPPSEPEVERALALFAADAARQYGKRLIGIHLFGSRARGNHGPESDADVAVILDDEDWRYWSEVRSLSRLTYDRLVQEGCDIQAVPIAASEWRTPETSRRAAFIHNVKRDAQPLWSKV